MTAAALGSPGVASGQQPEPTGGTEVVEIYRAPRRGPGGTLGFVDVTAEMRADDPLVGMRVHATAAADANGDGWSDLFVGTFADRPVVDYQARGADGPVPDRLLLGGPFGFRIDETFPGELARTAAVTFADLDADGDLDLVVGRNVRDGDPGRAPSRILRNEGGHFVLAAVLDRPRGVRAIGVLDFDGDTRLDLFVVEDRFTEGSSLLLRNEGGLRFADATLAAGLPNDVDGLGVSTADLNGDRAPDVFVSGSNRLFVNQRNGTFREHDVSATFRWPRFGNEDDPAGVAAHDVDGDGRVDLVIGQHYNSTVDLERRVPVRLYLNRGSSNKGTPRFRDVTREAGLRPLSTKAPQVEVADLDADGRLDILTTASAGDAPVIFRQREVRGDIPRFERVGVPRSPDYWVTAAVLDADRDGRLDVFLGEWDPGRASVLLRNRADTGHWLGVTAPPGTVVELFRPGGLGERPDRIERQEVGTSTGFASGPATTAWFGLGSRRHVDVRIVLPTSGEVVTLHRSPTDRLVRLE